MTKWSVVMIMVVLVIATMEREAGSDSLCLFECLKKCRHKDPSVRRFCICECVLFCIFSESPQGQHLTERKSLYRTLNQTCPPSAPPPSSQMKTSFGKETLKRVDVHG
ncbi:hypothetical protein Bca4012_061300 [Brassica carinata]